MASRKTQEKRKAKQRLARIKHRKPGANSVYDGLIRKVQAMGGPPTEMRLNVPGQERMSEVLLDFLDPYLSGEETKEELETMIRIGIIGWNAALISEEKRRTMVDDVMGRAPAEARAYAKRFLGELVERKQAYFADNKRMIVSYDIVSVNGEFRVNVASTLGKDAHNG